MSSNVFRAAFKGGWFQILSMGCLALSGCIEPQGITVRKNAAPILDVSEGGELLPKPNISMVLSPMDHVRVQILPVASSEGLLLEPYDVVSYQIEFDNSDYHLGRGD